MNENYQPIGKGLRLNNGKVRMDLFPTSTLRQVSQILTQGASKYADRNWERGMSWSSVLGSLKRHLDAFERGEDYDKESGQLHIAHVLCNAAFLTEYYSSFPEGDDRYNSFKYKKPRKIGLDIDDVLADFAGAYTKKFGIKELPKSWLFDRKFSERMSKLSKDKSFFMNIPVKTKPEDIPFEPHCYITSRGIPSEWTEEWLEKNGFPLAPVYTVPLEKSKVDVAKEAGIDTFVDDNFNNFYELNAEGILCYLFSCNHNARYDVGFRRIESLKEVPTLISK